MKKLFLDSCVLFTAVKSPTGGSSKLFTYKNIELYTSLLVLTEVERNVRGKLMSYHLDRFFLLVEKLKIIPWKPDLHMIEKAKTDILVTLDIKHFFTKKARDFIKPQKIMTPKMVIKEIEKNLFTTCG